MKRTTVFSLLVVLLAGPCALAGTVEFVPPEQTVAPGFVSVVVSVQTTIPDLIGIDSTDIVIGSELPVVSFTYSNPNTFETVYPPAPPGIYTHNVWAGASNTRPDTGGNSHLIVPAVFPVSIGTLVVDASGAADGDYTVWVDTSQDNCSGLGATVFTKGGGGSSIVTEALLGSAVIHVGGVQVTGTKFPCDMSLTRTQNHVLRLTFDGGISAPTPTQLEIRELLAGAAFGPNLSGSFTFTVEGGVTLRIAENGTVLQNEKWYGILNTGGWPGVVNFEVDYKVVRGDVNNSGFTNFADLSTINQHLTGNSTDNDVYDINASGFVNFADISTANGFINSEAPDKPSGHHQCSP